jgi:hypothetical protein
MEALLGGRISRSAACRLVTPWVEASGVSEPHAENGAQLIHGFDLVTTRKDHVAHASVIGEDMPYLLTDG